MSSSFKRLQQDAQQQVIEMLDDGCNSNEIIQYISECIDKLGYSFCTRDIISMAWYKEEMKLIDYLLWLYPCIFTSRSSKSKSSSIRIPGNALLDYVDDSRMANIIVILHHPNIDLNDQNLIHEILSLHDTDDQYRNCWNSLLKPLLASKQKINLHQRYLSFVASYPDDGEEIITTHGALEFTTKTFLKDEECYSIITQYDSDPNKTRKTLRLQINYCKVQDSTMVYCLVLCIKQDWLAIINAV